MNRLTCYLPALLFILSLCGCENAKELNERLYINAIAVDYDKPDGVYTMSFDVFNTDREVITVKGDGIDVIAKKLGNATAKKPFLGHLKALVIGAGVLEDEQAFSRLIYPLFENREVSGNVIVLTADGGVSDIFDNDKFEESSFGDFIRDYYNLNDKEYKLTIDDLVTNLHNGQSFQSLSFRTPQCHSGLDPESKRAKAEYQQVYSLKPWGSAPNPAGDFAPEPPLRDAPKQRFA